MDGVRDTVGKDPRPGRQVALVWLFDAEADVVDRVHERDVPHGPSLDEAELVTAAKGVLLERLTMDDPDMGDLIYVLERADGTAAHVPSAGPA